VAPSLAGLPNTTLTVWPDSGHIGFAKHVAEILATVAPRPRVA